MFSSTTTTVLQDEATFTVPSTALFTLSNRFEFQELRSTVLSWFVAYMQNPDDSVNSVSVAGNARLFQMLDTFLTHTHLAAEEAKGETFISVHQQALSTFVEPKLFETLRAVILAWYVSSVQNLDEYDTSLSAEDSAKRYQLLDSFLNHVHMTLTEGA